MSVAYYSAPKRVVESPSRTTPALCATPPYPRRGISTNRLGALYIVLDSDAPDFDTFVNGKALAHEENLVALCKKLGLRTLDDFVVMSEDDISDWLGDDTVRPVGEEDPWFTTDDGLEFIAVFSSHIKANPKAGKDAAGCLEDLAEYTAVLEKARLTGAKWCLNLDF